jgi:hypothetical protein
MNCYRHPSALATAFCNVCSKAICGDCRADVAGYAMCSACVSAAQAELGGSSSTSSSTSGRGFGIPGSSAVGAGSEGCRGGQYLKAVLFSAVAAVLGAVIWDKIVLVTGYQLGIIAVVLGALVGIAVRVGAEGRPGAGLPWIGALMAGFSIFLGHAFLIHDVLKHEAEYAAVFAVMSLPARLSMLLEVAVHNLDIMDWAFVAIGVYEGWKIPHALNREAEG